MRKHKGFTLVELLVAVGIISLLISILLPALGAARAQARKAQCMANLRQWGAAMVLYADGNKGAMPRDGDDGDKPSKAVSTADDPALWINALPPFISGRSYYEMQEADLAGGARLPVWGDNSIFTCPEATDAAGVSGKDLNDGAYFSMWFFKPGTAQAVQRRTFICYVINSKLNSTRPTLKLPMLQPSSEVVLMLEKRMRVGECPPADPNIDSTLARLKADAKRFSSRHHNGGNVLFADQHVQWFPYAEATRLTAGDYNQPGKLVWNPFGPAN